MTTMKTETINVAQPIQAVLSALLPILYNIPLTSHANLRQFRERSQGSRTDKGNKSKPNGASTVVREGVESGRDPDVSTACHQGVTARQRMLHAGAGHPTQ